MNNYYQNLTRQYSVIKTLRNELIPVGKTLDYIKERELIEIDAQRKQDYIRVKQILDDYHKQVIASMLEKTKLSHDILNEVFEIYCRKQKSDADIKTFDLDISKLRKEISESLREHQNFAVLFKKELFTNVLPSFVEPDDIVAINNFIGFTTYFTSYNKVRENLYSDEDKAQTVAYRTINENLPKFFSNIKTYSLVKAAGLKVDGFTEEEIDRCFIVEEYEHYISQKGITFYNSVMGAINSAINLYNQANYKMTGFKKLPKLIVLFKQILSDREESFILEFLDDEEILTNLEAFEADLLKFISSKELGEYVRTLQLSKGENVYIKNDTSLTTFSNIALQSWNAINILLSGLYDKEYKGKKTGEKYDEEKATALKKIKSYSLSELQECEDINLVEAYVKKLLEDIETIKEKASLFEKVVLDEHDRSKKFANNTKAVDATKSFLDAVKSFERDLKLIQGSGLEPDKNEVVYGELDFVLGEIKRVDTLYNMTRNYVTKKPFSTEKFKLNFNCPTFLNGWDKNKEKDNLGVLFLRDGNYYLGIMDNKNKKCFESIEKPKTTDVYRKVEYKLLPGPNKMLPKVFFAKTNIDYFAPSDEIIEIRKKESFKKGNAFNIEDCHKFIDFFKESIEKHEDWKHFEFKFSDTNQYSDISEFYREIDQQNYKISFVDIDSSYIDELVDAGKLYLFKIYNADYSPNSKGNLNLHTIYFKMLFDERNLNNICYKLNGEAEVFYRPASITQDDVIVHCANVPINNKNTNGKKPQSVFEYDIIKDRRYTKDKFFLHTPITMNCNSGKMSLLEFNRKVNESLHASENVNVIGIDRGERNLLYVVVIDSNGNVLEQISLNEIVNKKYDVTTNYHDLLKSKSDERLKSRQDWKTIESIKDLKTGYLSQVVNVISSLIIKYNAIVCLEALNPGFKRTRSSFEFSVYQKFEKMLIDKLNYMVIDKSRNLENVEEVGKALNAIQLTSAVSSYNDIRSQVGALYYVPAAYTSKIDPVTGFINLLQIKYENIDKAKDFISRFDNISYDTGEDMFLFELDYDKFTYKAEGTRTHWTIYTYKDRIINFRNSEKNNSWDTKKVVLSNEFKRLFDKYDINYTSDTLKAEILNKEDASFYKEFLFLLKLTLQMRNSDSLTGEDFIISPVKSYDGTFYDSRTCKDNLPKDADANGAYNIARKGLWLLEQIKSCSDFTQKKAIRYAMTNKEWFKYIQ